jgi:hypothetical protein
MKVTHSILLCIGFASFAAASAGAELVIIVNPKSPAVTMSVDEVANVYLGKDPRFSPVDLPESAQARSEFYMKVAGKNAAQVKALWARLVFTGKMQPPKEVASPGDALKFVADNDRGMAYVEKSALDNSVKTVLTVN